MVQYFEPLPSRKLHLGGQQVKVSLGTGAFICKGARPIRAFQLSRAQSRSPGHQWLSTRAHHVLAVAPPLGLVVLGAEVLSREPGACGGVREGRAASAPTGGSCLGCTAEPSEPAGAR